MVAVAVAAVVVAVVAAVAVVTAAARGGGGGRRVCLRLWRCVQILFLRRFSEHCCLLLLLMDIF